MGESIEWEVELANSGAVEGGRRRSGAIGGGGDLSGGEGERRGPDGFAKPAVKYSAILGRRRFPKLSLQTLPHAPKWGRLMGGRTRAAGNFLNG